MRRLVDRSLTMLRPIRDGDATLLAKLLAVFVAVLTLSTATALLLETSITRQQLARQAAGLFEESGDVFDHHLADDAARINQLMSTVAQALEARSATAGFDVTETDRVALDTLSVLKTSDDDLQITAVISAVSGAVVDVGLPSGHAFVSPGENVVDEVSGGSGRTQRVLPLRGGGYGVAHVLPIHPLADEPRLLVVGYPLDDLRARRFRQQAGIDDVEIVVAGNVVGSTVGVDGQPPSGEPSQVGITQQLDDGRLVRYVSLGAVRPWDTPAYVGLIAADPLSALDVRLTRTRWLLLAVLVLIGASLAFIILRVMTRPIRALTRTATAIARGDLDRAFAVESSDEIGRLGDALERMRRALRAQLLVIRQQAQALQEAARRMVAVQDTERRRVAQDLHDGIQQRLVVLRMQVGAARTRLENDPDSFEEVTSALAVAIDGLLDELRSTGQGLFPSILSDRGLGAALFSLAGRAQVPLVVELEPDPFPRLDREVEANAYFLISEAVTNALKHADAHRIVIDVRVEDRSVRVAVRDDGVGFDPSATAHRGGLVHMRDRVNALAGSLQLVSRPGEGTSVTALFPLGDPSVGGSLQVEQDGGDSPVELDLLGESEFPEDGVSVLLDRPIADRELPGDGGVSPS